MTMRGIILPVQGIDDHDSVMIDDPYCSNLRNVRSDRLRIIQSPGGTLMAPAPLPNAGNPGYGMSVGTFTKQAGTGNQTVTHSLGVAPVALILFVSGARTQSTITANMHLGFGFTDGTTTKSVATMDTDAVATNSSTGSLRRFDSTALITILSTAAVTSSAAFVSFGASNFVINWTVNDGVGYQISYVVIGQAGMSAKVIQWTLQGTVGNQALATVGFTPDLVINIGAGGGAGPFPGSASGAGLAFGVMAPQGQFAWAIAGGPAGVDHSSGTMQASNRCYVSGGQPAGTAPLAAASYVSMDLNGFTVNIPSSQASQVVASLALKGLPNVATASIARTTSGAPTTQAVTGLGFQPKALFIVGAGGDQASGSFGAADPVNQWLHAIYESDGGPTTSVVCYQRTDNAYVDLTVPPTARTANVLGSVKSLDADGFTLSYSMTSSTLRNFFYLALNFSSTTGGSIGVIRNYGDLIVGGTTPIEKIVMLTSKSAFVYTPSTSSTGVFSPTAEAYTGTDTQRFSIANSTDSAYGAVAAWSQGKDNIRYYDGSTFGSLITVGTNIAARTLVAFNNRIVAIRPFFGGIDHKTQIRWCINGTFNDWAGTGSGTLEIVETSNQALTGGFTLGDRCYITRARETIELIATGSLTPVFRTEVRVSGIGAISTHSIATGDVYGFFLGPDEIYQWDGSTLRAVGGRIYNTITQLVDYENLDQIQATVYEPDSQYWVVVPPYIFIYDYRRDIWDWDDIRSFQAIGRLTVQDLFTADINHSEFIVIGDSSVQTIREDPSVNTYLGAPIDSYFETKDLLPFTMGRGGQVAVDFDRVNSVYRVWFRSTPGLAYEVGVSTDKGLSYSTQIVTVNAGGVGIAFFLIPFNTIRVRVRSQPTSQYSVQAALQLEWGSSGMTLPP